MNRRDLADLERLLSSVTTVVSMRQVHEGARDPNVIGLRHDVDDNRGSLDTAVKIAGWEAERGYRSTFFLLHTASYWQANGFPEKVETIASYGHEIGIHADAIGAALEHGGDPARILGLALAELRNIAGPNVVGVAPHGNSTCRRADGSLLYVNDEIFTECPRPEVGAPDRTVTLTYRTVKLNPRPLAEFGLEYECYRLPRGRYLSDSGNRWNVPPSSLIGREHDGQCHILWHPDWWGAVFA